MASETIEGFKALREVRKAQARERVAAAEAEFAAAAALAESKGLRLSRCAAAHYQLRPATGEGCTVDARRGVLFAWLINVHPGTCRLYAPPEKRGPFLALSVPWTLTDVVEAAAAALENGGV